jgi:hypothetical protein
LLSIWLLLAAVLEEARSAAVEAVVVEFFLGV